MKYLQKYWPVLLILLAFLSGRFTAPDDSKGELEKLKKDREILIQGIIQKQVEINKLDQHSKAQEKKIAKLEVEVEKSDKKAKAIETRYRKKLADVAKYTPVQRDSFFYAKYPGQDTIRNVDSRKVMADLVHGEGQDSLNLVLMEQVDTLKAVVSEQKEQIKTEKSKFEKQKEITSDFVKRGDSYRDELEISQKSERKQRRQRNGLAAGLVGVIILSLIK